MKHNNQDLDHVLSSPTEQEMEQRLQDVLSGRVQGIPVNEAMRQARLVAGITEPPPTIENNNASAA